MPTNTISTNQDLYLYQLNDSITKLNLLTKFQTAKPLDKFKLIINPDANEPSQVSIGPFPFTMPREDSANIYADVFNPNKWVGNMQLERQRRIVFEVGNQIYIQQMDTQLNDDENFKLDENMDGQFLLDNRSILIHAQNHGLYYLVPTDKQDFEMEVDFEVYHADENQSDALIISILNQNANLRFKPNLNAFNALKEFWLAQVNANQDEFIKINDDDTKSKTTGINSALTQIFNHVLADQNNDKTNFQINLTYHEVVEFYNEVQNRRLTKATQNVQDWLFGDKQTTGSINDLLNLLSLHANFNDLKQQIQTIQGNDNAEIKAIIKQLQKDRYFPKLKNIDMQIYALNNPEKNYEPNAKHFMGVHGTNACSIPTILCDGLKSNVQLKGDSDANYLETAQGLGDGTYFARLDQASKALNYAGDDNRSYLMIADVAYIKPILAKNYLGNGVSKHQYDFVEGIKVGNLHNYDEYVAVNPQKQVTLKYLIEITKKSKNEYKA